MNTSLLIASTILLLAVASTPASASLDFTRVHLVDMAAGNFLFRGNMPVNSTGFAYDQLVQYMSERALSEGGVKLPAQIYLIDVSLSNPFDPGFAQDQAFWANGANSNLGEWINWPLGTAGLLPPSAYPPAVAQQMALNGSVWKVDQTPSRVAILNKMLNTPAAVPQVIYVHCNAGCDRTGEVIGAYRMQFEGKNTTTMYELDTYECGRSPNYFSTSALEWYCIYYTASTGNNIGDCETFATCALFGKCQPTAPNTTAVAIADAVAHAEVEIPLFERTKGDLERFAHPAVGVRFAEKAEEHEESERTNKVHAVRIPLLEVVEPVLQRFAEENSVVHRK